ncbi:SPL family radical SAM protein [Thermofilum sp.]|uniref:SPL family radical SAM protein n=1 Tax=Thermofilum sp. TaxID=1961369 RepID=UPI00317EE9AC
MSRQLHAVVDMLSISELVKKSALTKRDSGKDLSTGWVVNFAVGCTHGCLFCYVQRITEKLNPWKLPEAVFKEGWGSYLYVYDNLHEAVEKTQWWRWRDEVVLMSSTHDPYLPQLYFPHKWPRRILEAALPHGVKFNILTRSALALQDLDLFVQYRMQIRLMYSLPTLDDELARTTEPNVPLPSVRLVALRKAKTAGARIGVIVAPIIPRFGWERDLTRTISAVAGLEPEIVFGEMLHPRGSNLELMARKGVEFLRPNKAWDERIGRLFEQLLAEYGLKGEYWYEYD